MGTHYDHDGISQRFRRFAHREIVSRTCGRRIVYSQTGDLILGFREFTSICRVGISGKSWDSVLLFSSLLLLSVGHLGDSWLLQLEILTGWQD